MEGKRNHHRKLFQVWVCDALVYQTRDEDVARTACYSARTDLNDKSVFMKTVYRDTSKEEAN